MKTEVSISERLKDLRVEKKLNLEELAELTGISKSALGSYELDTPREMNHKNLIALADFYEVSVDYLLGRTENRNLPNAPLSELRLSDATVELLKSGSINNRLLCELVTHEKFAELLADVEIYVDGLAASRFHDLKQSLAADRARLLEEHPEAVTDRAFRIFDAGMIEEDDFFCHITHKAWDAKMPSMTSPLSFPSLSSSRSFFAWAREGDACSPSMETAISRWFLGRI